MAEFLGMMERTGGPFAALDHMASHVLFVLLVAPTRPWDYKRQLGEQYEPFGNFHFGIVAAAAGYDEVVAESGGGIVQIVEDLLTRQTMPSEGIPFLEVPVR